METIKPKSKFKTWHKVVAGIIVFFIFIGIFSSGKETKAADDPGTSSSSSVATTEAPMAVNAKTFFTDYKANEVAADEKYKGKLLEISGIVESINKDFTDDIYINLVTVSDFEYVRCDLNEDNKAAAGSLKKGQKVTVVGEGSTMVIGTPSLKNCSIK